MSNGHWILDKHGNPNDQAQDRCSGNREQAEAMHERWVAKVKGIPNDNLK